MGDGLRIVFYIYALPSLRSKQLRLQCLRLILDSSYLLNERFHLSFRNNAVEVLSFDTVYINRVTSLSRVEHSFSQFFTVVPSQYD